MRAIKEATRPFEPPSKSSRFNYRPFRPVPLCKMPDSRAREGPRCRGWARFFGCPCFSREVVGSRSHTFTKVFLMRQATPSAQVLQLQLQPLQNKRILKCSPGKAGLNLKSFITWKREKKTQREGSGVGSDPLSRLSRVPEVLLLLSSPPHCWAQPHHQPRGRHEILGCLGRKYSPCILHPMMRRLVNTGNQ